MSRKILVLFAHPSQRRSEVNVPLFRASQGIDRVTTIDLYQEYPTFKINIELEQQRLRDHDVIIFMFPVYWYSTPAILKEWQDLVLEYGFAYGHEGTALQDKLFLCAITAGGPNAAYQAGGFNHFSIRELLRPLEQTARLCGMKFLPPFAMYASRTAVEEDRIRGHAEDWRKILRLLQEENFKAEQAQDLLNLNDLLDHATGVNP